MSEESDSLSVGMECVMRAQWNRGQLPDGRITMDWKGDGKPKYPTGELK